MPKPLKAVVQRELSLDNPKPRMTPRLENGGGLKVVSLFAGCGGLDLGLVGGFTSLGIKYPKTGMSIAWAADFDRDAAATYKANARFFGDHQLFEGDVRSFENFESLPNYDILAAGFPCQPFSNAGDREGVGDSRGRGTLFEECERFVVRARRKPLAYIFENVKGILSSKMPNGRLVPDEIGRRMEALGYVPSPPALLRANEYGVPQQRHRVFMIGVLKGIGPGFDTSRIADFVVPAAMERLTVRDALKGASRHSGGREHWALSPQAMKLVPMIKRSWKDIPYSDLPPRFQRIRDQMVKYRAPNFYRRFGLDEINGTITASAQPENCGILHPEKDRRYTIREVARFQSFPDDFVFSATTMPGKYKVIGNAVPPVLGFAVGSALQDYLSTFASGRLPAGAKAAS